MNVQKKVVSVVGPTASGKSQRALEIAREAIVDGQVAGVDLISVDSRQVYQGLEILTGADVPVGFEKRQLSVNLWAKNDSLTAVRTRQTVGGINLLYGGSNMRSSFERFFAQYSNYYANEDDSIRLFGVSMIQPSDEWSVAHFQQYARVILVDSWLSNRLPILVGGTGLYHREICRQDKKLHVPPNEEVRKKAEGMSVEELQEWLKKVDSQRLAKMNESDRGNPRRLVRAIEVGIGRPSINRVLNKKGFEIADQIWNDDIFTQHDLPINWSRMKAKIIFVSADLDLIKEKIEKRVKERFEKGSIDEVRWLLSLKLSPTLSVLTTLGVPEITKFLQGEISAKECQKLWSLHEYQYAKRQLTWWKKFAKN